MLKLGFSSQSSVDADDVDDDRGADEADLEIEEEVEEEDDGTAASAPSALWGAAESLDVFEARRMCANRV